ncbi:MAG TPA: type II toxin-antitoxin system VapC family toxin [Solirubrobacterales bacterium]|nr:type II toxin-antitoxin system VapC family toxin [Solirubrobacterales bacterium]
MDASVAVKWFLPVEREPEGELARRAVGQLAMRTTTLAFYEVGNVLARNSSWDGERVSKALALLHEICGEPLDLTPADHRVAGGLAFDHGITFYDASYAAIARRLGRVVLSADSDLTGPGLAASLETALA